MTIRLYFYISLLLLVVGCATSVEQPSQDFQQQYLSHVEQVDKMSRWVLTGRLSIRNAEENWSGTVRWSQFKDNFEFHFSGPLGQGAVRIEGSDRGVTLQASDGSTLSGASVSELVHRRLGWHMPFEQLAYWVRGLPDPTSKEHKTLDDSGRIAELEQSQWQIRYKRYEVLDGYDVELPKKIFLKNVPWQIRLVVDDWQYKLVTAL